MDAQRIKRPKPPGSTNRWVWIMISVIVVIFIILRIADLASGDDGFGVGDKVGLVRIEGPIMSSRTVVADLDALSERNDIKSILVRINSPGGAIAPSQEIYEKLRSVRAIKPVITSMGSVAASGGYYIALGSSVILANKGTITGSIGVIMEYPVAVELLDKIGLSIETVKSGKLKDAGSGSREATEQDRQYFQDIVGDLHGQFIDVVTDERALDRNTVMDLADGRVYTGTQSLALGLIDSLGTLEDAVNLAGQLGNITGKPKTFEIKHRRTGLMELLMGSGGQTTVSWFHSMPVYRWRGK